MNDAEKYPDQMIKQKENLLAAMKKGLDEQKETARAAFNDLLEIQRKSDDKKLLTEHKKSLGQAQAHEDEIQALLAREDAKTIDLDQKNLVIQELEDQLALTKEMYDTIARRIQEVRMDLKRPACIYVESGAYIAQVLDNRAKYTVALVFGAMALGILLAMLRDRAITQHSIITG